MNEQFFTSLNGYEVKDKYALHTYDSVANMKADTKLKEGMHVKTKGYYSANDGGESEYIITSDNNNSIFKIELNNNLYAELLNKEIVKIDSLGANNLEDCSNLLQALFDYPVKEVTTSGKEYLVQNDISITKKIIFDGNDCKINLDNCTLFINIPGTQQSSHYDYFGEIKNIHFIANSNKTVLENTRGYKGHVYNCEFKGFTGTGLVHKLGYETVYELLRFDGVGTNTIGMDIQGNDIIIKDIYAKDCHTFIKTTGSGNFFTNLHAWIYTNALIDGSIFIDNYTDQINKYNNIYFDTYQTCVDCHQYSELSISNAFVLMPNIQITPLPITIFELHGHPFNGERIFVDSMYIHIAEAWRTDFTINSETQNLIQFNGLMGRGFDVSSCVTTQLDAYINENCENINCEIWEGKDGVVNIKGIIKATFDNTDRCDLLDANSYTKPVNDYEGVVSYSTSRWLKNLEQCFLAVSKASGKVYVILEQNYTGTLYFFIDIQFRRILQF